MWPVVAPSSQADAIAAQRVGDHAILAASETGEDYAVKKCKEALEETLPAPVRDIVKRQFQSVKRAHGKVKGMRDRLDKSTGSASR